MDAFQKHLERYKKGTATPEEAAQVREEIEKHEAISNFLTEEFSEQLLSPKGEGQLLSASAISHKVNVKLFRTLWLVILSLVVLAAAIVLGCNLYFYNPNRGIPETDYGGSGQLLVDMMAFSELHSPGYTTSSADAQWDGPGSYQVRFQQENLFDGTLETNFVPVVRGKVNILYLSSDDYLHLPYGNAFSYEGGSSFYVNENGSMKQERPSREDQQNNIKALTQLPDSSQASVYVTFPKALPLSRFSDVYQKWTGRTRFLYAAVTSNDNFTSNIIGFVPDPSGAVLADNHPDKEKYPDFQLYSASDKKEDNVTMWTTHFDSLLRYMTTRSSFINAMTYVNGISAEYYQNVLDYVNKYGIEIYGVLITGNVKDVLEFLDQVPYFDFFVSGVRLSKFPG